MTMNQIRKTLAVVLGAFAALCLYIVLMEDASAGPVLLLIASVAGTYFLWPKTQGAEASTR